MSMYQIPPAVNEKEKVIGGILTMKQFVWIMAGVGVGLVLFLIAVGTTGSIGLGIFLAIPAILAALPFAFKKKKGLELFQYLRYKRKLKNKNVYLVNKRKDVK